MEELAPGQIVAGKLMVVRRLGAGGVGAVWEVEHTLTKHRRAMKVLHPRFANRADVLERFLREASAAGRIGDPHICETFDAGTLESQAPYLLMELLAGQSLGDRLRHGRVDVAEAVFILRQACLGVAAAHDAGIVHRDLKPDNLFVAQLNGKPFVKVLDFGVSRFDELGPGEEKLTAEGTTLGTPRYMSPEQIAGRGDLDRRADVYALGVILYEAVSGRPPYEAASMAALAVQIHQGQPTPLSTSCPDLPADFVAVVERAMHADRDRRFPDARALSDALAPFELDAALDSTAPRIQKTEQLPRPDRKRPVPALLYLVPLAVAAAAAVYFALPTPAAPIIVAPPPPVQPVVAPPPPVVADPPPVVAAPPPADPPKPKPKPVVPRKKGDVIRGDEALER